MTVKLNSTTGKEFKKLLVFVGMYSSKKFQEITDGINFIKPKGGLWTSPYLVDKGSEWIEWCVSENFDVNGSMHADNPISFISIKNNARILVIDEYEDLCNAISLYGRDDRPASLNKMDGGVMNFERVSKHFDAIFLTSKGQWKTRLTRPNLYGWDCETIYIMKKNIIRHVKFGKIDDKWVGAIRNEREERIKSFYRPIQVENDLDR